MMERSRIAGHSVACSKIHCYKHAHFQPAGQKIDKTRYGHGGAAVEHEVTNVLCLSLSKKVMFFKQSRTSWVIRIIASLEPQRCISHLVVHDFQRLFCVDCLHKALVKCVRSEHRKQHQ